MAGSLHPNSMDGVLSAGSLFLLFHRKIICRKHARPHLFSSRRSRNNGLLIVVNFTTIANGSTNVPRDRGKPHKLVVFFWVENVLHGKVKTSNNITLALFHSVAQPGAPAPPPEKKEKMRERKKVKRKVRARESEWGGLHAVPNLTFQPFN